MEEKSYTDFETTCSVGCVRVLWALSAVYSRAKVLSAGTRLGSKVQLEKKLLLHLRGILFKTGSK